jgi:hypothetical protein
MDNGLAVASRDLVTRLAFEGLSENEIGRARISIMARSDLLHARAGYRSARPVTATPQIQLATHGRSIQKSHNGNPPFLALCRLLATMHSGRRPCKGSTS